MTITPIPSLADEVRAFLDGLPGCVVTIDDIAGVLLVVRGDERIGVSIECRVCRSPYCSGCVRCSGCGVHVTVGQSCPMCPESA